MQQMTILLMPPCLPAQQLLICSYALPFVHALQAKSHNGANEETQLGSPSAELPPVLQKSNRLHPRRREWSFCSHGLTAELFIVHYSLFVIHVSL